MSEKVAEKNETSYFGKEHEIAIDALFEDLTRLYPTDRELFRDLFYNREEQHNKFSALVTDNQQRTGNYIFEGKAGVGKTSFIYRIESDEVLQQELNFVPVVVDYRKSVPQSSSACLVNFIESMQGCFEKIDCPIHTLTNNIQDNIDDNIHAIEKHLRGLDPNANIPNIIIFLDDFDYLEDTWYELLRYFLSFAASDYVSIVLTARPPLIRAIDSYDDRFAFFFTRNVKKIKLGSLDVENVLISRLAPLLAKKQIQSKFDLIISTFRRKSSIEQMLRKLGIKDLNALRTFEFPLTNKHCDFMKAITNGNLREVFNIAIPSILFALEEGSSLANRTENNVEKKIIGHENTLKLFYIDDNPDSKYHIININKYKSKSRNSLLYNVLEAVKIFQILDENFYDTLAKFGHNKKAVNWAIEFLSDKVHRFVEPTTLLPPTRHSKLKLYEEYKILDKGEFYLYMAGWDEYCSERRAGSYGRSIIKEMKS
ncbi:MAG: hypothetical protein ACYS1A_10880 [Planctomycetota bacterium]|jgi:hypothetical protein